MCYLVPFVELAVSHTSVLTILAITVERYIAICLPLQAGIVCTKSKACLTCLVIWLFAFGLTAPILAMIEYTIPPEEEPPAGSGSGSDPACFTHVDTYWQKFYFIFIITVFFFIPLLILILLYVNIARNLVPKSTSDDDQVSHKKLIYGIFDLNFEPTDCGGECFSIEVAEASCNNAGYSDRIFLHLHDAVQGPHSLDRHFTGIR